MKFKILIQWFIGTTNHLLGFQQALQIIESSKIPANETVMLLYISRGLLSSLTEPKSILKSIGASLSNIKNNVIINTCAVIDGMYCFKIKYGGY